MLGHPARAAFLLLAAAVWIVYTPIRLIYNLISQTIISPPLLSAGLAAYEDMPGGHITSLATSHLSRPRPPSAPWSLTSSISERLAPLRVACEFLVFYAYMIALGILVTVSFAINLALEPFWRGFRDWGALRTNSAHFIVSESGRLYDFQYEYLQGEWRWNANSTPWPRRRLFVALGYMMDQVWLLKLSSSVLGLARGLITRGSLVIEGILQTILESAYVPFLVKTILSAFIVVAYPAEIVLRKNIADEWVTIFADQAKHFVTAVHNTEQRKKRERNQRIYDTLSSPEDMVRVLRILPGIRGQPLECFIRAEPRSSAKYEALSYVWGDPTLQRFIRLNGMRYTIGKNLYDCLVHLRKATAERELWVDALCINQANGEEKRQQVLLMGDLYKRAEQVVVWLGLDVKGVAELFSQARQSGERDSAEAEAAHLRPHHPNHSCAIQHLLCSPWWSRVWTVQELILGSLTIVQCRKFSLPWDAFCQMLDHNAKEMKPSDLARTFHPQYLALKRERQLYRQHVERRHPLLERIYAFRGKQSSLAVDRIFGFYGLLDDPVAEIKPEYFRPSMIAEGSFAIDFINRFKSLAVVAIAELSTAEDEKGARWEWFPRWNIDGSTSAKTLFWTGLGDEIGGQPWSEDGFNAASGRLVRGDCEMGDHPLNDPIALEGWHTETVTMSGAIMANEDVDSGRWHRVVEQWLSMACGSDHANKAEKGREESLRLFYKTITAGLFDTEQPPASPQHAKYLEAVRHACRCRRLFLTSSGRYGIGPQDTACGDEIWVLLGMAVPVVLGRRVARNAIVLDEHMHYVGSKRDDYEDWLRYLGQAYIDDLVRPGRFLHPGAGPLSERSLETAYISSGLK